MASLRSTLNSRANRLKLVRLTLFLLGVLLFSYISRRSLRWHSRPYSTVSAAFPCAPCSCDCLSEPTLDLPSEAFNNSLADCGKDDPELHAELKKDVIALLSEEIKLQKNLTDTSFEHARALTMGAKKTSLHYQREAEKCNAAVEACEESRERAEAALIEERKLTALWISRAREYGWDEDTSNSL